MIRTIGKYVCAVVVLVAAAACHRASSAGDERPVLVVSIEPQRALLQQIVGDHYRVVSLMPKGENPEVYEPSMMQRRYIDNCAAYFTIGHFPFEESIAESAGRGVNIVCSTEGIKPVYGTHGYEHAHGDHSGHSHGHDAADPHMWTSVRNMRRMADVMAQAMIRIDADNAAEYTERRQSMDAHLDSLDAVFTARLSAVAPTTFLMWHPSLSYFARDYGLEQMSVGYDNKEVSIGRLREVIDEARADSVRVFFFQEFYDMRQSEAISQGVGARLVPVNLAAYDWEAQLNTIVDELTRR